MTRRNWITAIVVMAAVIALLVPAVGFTAGQTRAQDHQDTDRPTRDRLQAKDGSCQDDVSDASREAEKITEYPTPPDPVPGKAVDPDLDRIQDRLQDGSCQD